MAILKHIASKNADYGKSLEYLMFEHTENGTPVRNAEGDMIMREGFILDGMPAAMLTVFPSVSALSQRRSAAGTVSGARPIFSSDVFTEASFKFFKELHGDLCQNRRLNTLLHCPDLKERFLRAGLLVFPEILG